MGGDNVVDVLLHCHKLVGLVKSTSTLQCFEEGKKIAINQYMERRGVSRGSSRQLLGVIVHMMGAWVGLVNHCNELGGMVICTPVL